MLSQITVTRGTEDLPPRRILKAPRQMAMLRGGEKKDPTVEVAGHLACECKDSRPRGDRDVVSTSRKSGAPPSPCRTGAPTSSRSDGDDDNDTGEKGRGREGSSEGDIYRATQSHPSRFVKILLLALMRFWFWAWFWFVADFLQPEGRLVLTTPPFITSTEFAPSGHRVPRRATCTTHPLPSPFAACTARCFGPSGFIFCFLAKVLCDARLVSPIWSSWCFQLWIICSRRWFRFYFIFLLFLMFLFVSFLFYFFFEVFSASVARRVD